MRVTLMLRPSAIIAWMAGTPSAVAGDLHVEVRLVDRLVQRAGGRRRCRRCRGPGRARPPPTRSRRSPSLLSYTGRSRASAPSMSVVTRSQYASVTDVPPLIEVAELLVVVGAGADRLLEDRRVGGEAADAAVDPRGELAAGEPAPAEVVEPRALPERRAGRAGGRACAHSKPSRSRSRARARSATCSGVNPSSASTRSPGAEAPKRSIDDGVVGPAVPAERHAGLDRQGGDLGRQDLVLHLVGLLVEQLPAGERRHLRVRCPRRRAARRPPTATCTSLPVATSTTSGSSAGRRTWAPRARLTPAVPSSTGQVLPREDERGGPVVLDGQAPGLGGLVGVGGPDHPQPGDGAQRGDVLDRLVGGTVLADADGVVGEGVDDLGPRRARPGAPTGGSSR